MTRNIIWPHQERIDEEESSDEENGHAEADLTFKWKNGNLSPPENEGRLSTDTVIRIDDITSCFELFWTQSSVKAILVNLTNLKGKQGKRMHESLIWVVSTDPEMTLPAVYGMQSPLGQIFQAIVSLQKMYMLLRVICFDRYKTRSWSTRQKWLWWVQLVRSGCFRGPCPFKQPSKQCKCGIKVLQHVMPGHVMLGTCRFILGNPLIVLVKEPREVCGSGDWLDVSRDSSFLSYALSHKLCQNEVWFGDNLLFTQIGVKVTQVLLYVTATVTSCNLSATVVSDDQFTVSTDPS